MKTLNNYLGISPFTVSVDDSPKLRELAVQARELKSLPFQEKLTGVKKLVLNSMTNAYEQMVVWDKKAKSLDSVLSIGPDGKLGRFEYDSAVKQHRKFRDIVGQSHPLSYALEQKAGCCRYQGALFFVLGYEAGLGDQHFVQAAPVVRSLNTVFNEVVDNGQHHKVSMFTESLVDKSLDYSRQNPRIFEQAFEALAGFNFYSYHKTPEGLVIVENPNQHAKCLVK